VRQILPAVDTESLASTSNEDPQLSTWILLFGTMLPLLAPFLEEIVFRYVLFFKFIKYKFIAPILFIISSILFWVVHFNNFDGNLFLTIPFMVTGAYFALIYYFTKNIWYSISVHFISNFALSLLPVLFILVMQIFTTN
jgi:membrane protease YdiL (CAAX protease family)